MDKETLAAHTSHAWTLTFIIWLTGAALLYFIHHLIGSIRDSDIRWWLDAGLYVVAFCYFLVIGPLHGFFLNRLCSKSDI